MQIRFNVPVDVSGCRVIPASASPHTGLLPSFKGQTKPATFTVEVFAKSLRFPSDRFQRLARPFTFSGDANAQLDVEVHPQTVTSRIVSPPSACMLCSWITPTIRPRAEIADDGTFLSPDAVQWGWSLQPIITDHLVIRGHYSSLSLAVYGKAAEEFTVTLPEQAAKADVAKKAAAALKAAADAEVDLPQVLH